MSLSLRWRGRSSTSSTTPPRRCSSVTSAASLDSSSGGGAFDKHHDAIELLDSAVVKPFSFRNLLVFDSINLQSTYWRNQCMLALMKMSSPQKYISHFGVDVCFLPQSFHYTVKELEPYRKIGDPEMDAILQFLSINNIKFDEEGCGCGAFDDVIAYAARQYLREKSATNRCCPVAHFYKHYYENTPPWVDYEELQRGIDVFLAYLPVAGCALFYRSLVGGFSIPQILDVLRASRYLVPSHLTSMTGHKSSVRTVEAMNRDRKLAEERLFDTGGFLACCFAPHDPATDSGQVPRSAASLRPGGSGWEAALRVRVLHAKIRRALLQSKRSGSDGQATSLWDIHKNGLPINQEDMAATLLAFSVNVLIGIEIISGEPLDVSEQRDYLALWRYLGWLLGVDTPENTNSSNSCENQHLPPIDPCGPRKQIGDENIGVLGSDLHNNSVLHSYATLESMILHLLHPDQSSRDLVAHLLNLRSSYMFRSEVCRKLLSEPLSDELGIQTSRIQLEGLRLESLSNIFRHISLKFLVYCFLLFLRVYTLLTIKVPSFRRCAIVMHGNLERKFLFLWEKSHKQRVTKAASNNRESVNASSTENKSHCPFSMIMDPRTKM